MTTLQAQTAFRERFGSPESAGIELGPTNTAGAPSLDANDRILIQQFAQKFPSKVVTIPQGDSGRLCRSVMRHLLANAPVSVVDGSGVQQPARSANPLADAVRRRHAQQLQGS